VKLEVRGASDTVVSGRTLSTTVRLAGGSLLNTECTCWAKGLFTHTTPRATRAAQVLSVELGLLWAEETIRASVA
jgi:hypothetical protein